MLEVKHLTVTDSRNKKTIIQDISFALKRNQCLGIVGESGSGKSLTAKAILGLLPPNLKATGSLQFKGREFIQAKKEEWRKVRGKQICIILQDAMTAFNPLDTIGRQMSETICENIHVSKKEAEKIAVFELEKMNINEPIQVLKKYPHQLSGGMLQRCMIAVALSVKPDLIIADEPTTALDSINQMDVVAEFERVRSEHETAMIFISHDLGVVQRLAQMVLVMKDGRQVEYGNKEDVFTYPQHEYTKYLLDTRIQLTKPFTAAMGRMKDDNA